jgi:cell division protein FtsA
MSGVKLEVYVHIVTGAVTLLQNLGPPSSGPTSPSRPWSSPRSQIARRSLADEKELGVGLIDIGAGTTEVAVYERGLWYTQIIPLGGTTSPTISPSACGRPSRRGKDQKKFGCALPPTGESRKRSKSPVIGQNRKPRILSRSFWPRTSSRARKSSLAWWITTSSAWASINRSTPGSS